MHGGGSKPIGPPTGNQNSLKHGFYAQPQRTEPFSIDALIREVYRRYVDLGDYIDERFEAGLPPIREVVHLFRLYGQTASQLRKLLYYRRYEAGAVQAIMRRAALEQALDELGAEWGVDL